MVSFLGRTHFREVRCRVTDRHTDRPKYCNPRCACAPRVNKGKHIPICHRELGPATEYGRRLAVIPLHLNAVLIGSVMRIADSILDLDT
ncbi:hypothetical protein GBAR_LOCUS15353 [Geodia barretti]|uniref:Uncharacterized protein n=1 Tax=Geodia barretti TaxID=519541 RepID=A0AA35SDT3_GEOBA|nr:hypothetical protein GBAR_LOCUS15353 [Geodia barretti]